MKDAIDYRYALSDLELLDYWGLFAEYPTQDRNQQRRVDDLLAGRIDPKRRLRVSGRDERVARYAVVDAA